MALPSLSSVQQPEGLSRPSRAQTFTDNLSSVIASKDTNIRNNGFETMKVTDATSSSAFTKSIGSIFSTINKSVSSAFSSLISVPDATVQTNLTDSAQQQGLEVKSRLGAATCLPAGALASGEILSTDASTPLMPATTVSSCQVPASIPSLSPSQLPSSSVPLADVASVAVGSTTQDDQRLKKINNNRPLDVVGGKYSLVLLLFQILCILNLNFRCG